MSARDRFKAANNVNFVKLGSEANKETIVDDIVNGLKEEEKESSESKKLPVKDVIPVKPTENVTESPLIDVIDKSKVGRPKEGESKKILVNLKIDNYYHARLIGGKYGGMTAYVNYLIEQDRKKEG